MIRRFVYHLFWNFYDYLGTYLLFGALSSLTLLLILTGAGGVLEATPSVMVRGVVLLTAIITAWVLLSASLAGFLPFALRGARDETPRMPDLLQAVRTNLGRYAVLALLLFLAMAVLVANVFFYFRMSAAPSRGVATAGTILGAAFFWVWLAAATYGTVLLIAAAAERIPLRQLFRRALMALVLAPGLWAFAIITLVAGTALCLFSRVGIVFLLPWFAVVSATAYRIVEQHADYLGEAREALGPDHKLSAYRRKALELAMNWELRQPRRTLRELIKPWEY